MGDVRFDIPYLLLAICLLIIAIIMFFSNLPSMKMDDAEKFTVAHLKIDAAECARRPLPGYEFFSDTVNDDFHFKDLGRLAAKNAKYT